MIVKTTFNFPGKLEDLPEEVFFPVLSTTFEIFLSSDEFTTEFPNHELLEVKNNIALLENTLTKETIYLAFFDNPELS